MSEALLTSEVLDLAADEIQKRGWCQGFDHYDDGSVNPNGSTGSPWGENGGPVCLEGAIGAAAGIDFSKRAYYSIDDCPAAHAVRSYLDWQNPHLFVWNDAEDRTAEEVIEVLRATAAVERVKEAAQVADIIRELVNA